MSELIDKYLATDLTLHLATGSYKFTDIHSDALPQLPTPFVNSTWVVITAWNPASNDQVTFEQNAKAQAELRVILESRYDAVFAARGDDSDPNSDYKGEEMLAVAVDPEEFEDDLITEFTDLAEAYGQNAFFSVAGNVLRVHPGIEPDHIGQRVKAVVKIA